MGLSIKYSYPYEPMVLTRVFDGFWDIDLQEVLEFVASLPVSVGGILLLD